MSTFSNRMSCLRPPITRQQRGVYAVEFAIVGSVFFLVLFAVIEVGRLFFVWNILTEASRRGARLATVCHFDQSALTADNTMLKAALFENVTLVPHLTTENLNVQYLQYNGTPAVDYGSIRLVRASITNYKHQMLIPGLILTLNSPNFSTTLPRESLGVTRYKYTQC